MIVKTTKPLMMRGRHIPEGTVLELSLSEVENLSWAVEPFEVDPQPEDDQSMIQETDDAEDNAGGSEDPPASKDPDADPEDRPKPAKTKKK